MYAVMQLEVQCIKQTGNAYVYTIWMNSMQVCMGWGEEDEIYVHALIQWEWSTCVC